MSLVRRIAVAGSILAADCVAGSSAAQAELVLSQLVVELAPGQQARADVEVWNNGKERAYVAADPRQITNPGKSPESSRSDPDPESLGLLVSPARMILEPGQRKLLRIATIAPNQQERVYRVTVKPVVGQLSSQGAGLKVLVGYDVLVLVRPPDMKPHVSGRRSAGKLTLLNDGNVSLELVDGRACDKSLKLCEAIPGGRLYAGAEKVLDVTSDRTVSYNLKLGSKLLPVKF